MLLSNLLGSSRSSRLYLRLREKDRLVYNIFSERRLLSWMGVFVIRGSAPNQKLMQTLKAIKEEIDKFVEDGANIEEIKLVKNLSVAQMLMNIDNPSEIAIYFANEAFYQKEIWFPEKRIEVINKIKAEGVNKLAGKIFKYSRLNLGLLGDIPPDKLKEIKNIFKTSEKK